MTALPVTLFLGVPLGLGLLVRWWLGRAVQCPKHYRLDGKVVLITGASSGIGTHTAKECLSRGAEVIIACRNEAKARDVIEDLKLQTGSEKIRFLEVDLKSLMSVETLGEKLKKESRIDVLINNAGYLGPKVLTSEGHDMTFVVNYLSHFLLTMRLLRMRTSVPEAEETPPLRVINLTSVSFKMAHINFDDVMSETQFDIFGAYKRSKLAMLLFSRELARVYAPRDVISVAVHPGAVYTALQHNWPGTFGYVLRFFARLLFRSPLDGAQTSVYCACVDDSDLLWMNGELIVDCRVVVSSHSQNTKEDCEKLWDLSMKYCA